MNTKRLYWAVCLSIFAIGTLAWAATPWLDFTINLTHSLPGRFYIIHKVGELNKGDLVAYRWHGGATYPPGSIFIKQVIGMPGDTVKRIDTMFLVNDRSIGLAKQKSKAGTPLTPAVDGVIQSGEYFVATSNPDSLDSRYALTGNIKQEQVIGKAYAIF